MKKELILPLISALLEEDITAEAKQSCPFEVGQQYVIRTVTHTFTGLLVIVTQTELVLEKCSWIPCSARWANFLEEGEQDEVEPYPEGSEVIIGRAALIDACKYKSELPLSQK